MAIRIDTITIATHQPGEVARFWRDFLGYRVAANRTQSVLLESDDGGQACHPPRCARSDPPRPPAG